MSASSGVSTGPDAPGSPTGFCAGSIDVGLSDGGVAVTKLRRSIAKVRAPKMGLPTKSEWIPHLTSLPGPTRQSLRWDFAGARPTLGLRRQRRGDAGSRSPVRRRTLDVLPFPNHLVTSRNGCVIFHERELRTCCNCKRELSSWAGVRADNPPRRDDASARTALCLCELCGERLLVDPRGFQLPGERLLLDPGVFQFLKVQLPFPEVILFFCGGFTAESFITLVETMPRDASRGRARAIYPAAPARSGWAAVD